MPEIQGPQKGVGGKSRKSGSPVVPKSRFSDRTHIGGGPQNGQTAPFFQVLSGSEISKFGPFSDPPKTDFSKVA